MTYLEITQANPCQDGWEWRDGGCRPTYETLEKLLSQERKSLDEIIGELAEEISELKEELSGFQDANITLVREIADLRGFRDTVLGQFENDIKTERFRAD